MTAPRMPERESTTRQLHADTIPVWQDVLDRLLDRSGVWFTGDGKSSGPKPQLANSKSRDDNE